MTGLQWFATLGVGGCLAGLMFFFYRKDANEWRQAWKGQTEMLMKVVVDNTASNTAVIKAVEANTRIVDAMQQRIDRIDRGRRNSNDREHGS